MATMVVLRSNRSGVWMGRLVRRPTAPGDRWVLADARRVWSWTGALSCSGLATAGPDGGKIEAPVRVEIISAEGDEICRCTPEALSAWARVAPWKP